MAVFRAYQKQITIVDFLRTNDCFFSQSALYSEDEYFCCFDFLISRYFGDVSRPALSYIKTMTITIWMIDSELIELPASALADSDHGRYAVDVRRFLSFGRLTLDNEVNDRRSSSRCSQKQLMRRNFQASPRTQQ